MHRILVCLDRSLRAPKVLATAVDLARRLDARLTLFRSVGLPPVEPVLTSDEDVVERLTREANQELFRIGQEVPPELLGGITVRVGTPWDGICQEAKAMAADLVIVGSHGYEGLDRVLGTTAAKVVNHAACSVLVVR